MIRINASNQTDLPGDQSPLLLSYFPIKHFRSSYFIASASEHSPEPKFNLNAYNNVIRKYYPKNILSAVYVARKLPVHLTSYTKGLKYLKNVHLQQIKGSLRSLKDLELLEPNYKSKSDAFCLKKGMLACKNLTTLRMSGYLQEECLKSFACLRRLQVLDLKLQDSQLEETSKSIARLNALKAITVRFYKIRSMFSFIQDSNHFLNFFKKILSKKTLKVFKIVLDSNCGHYQTETYAKLFNYIEQSDVEEWSIQALLAEDKVLEIAKKDGIFKQVEGLAIHPRHIKIHAPDGLELENGSFSSMDQVKNKTKRLLDIYLIDGSRQLSEENAFDLELLVKECPKLEWIFIGWDHVPLKQPAHSEVFQAYKSLKAVYFDEKDLGGEESSWEHILQILENTPSLERIYLYVREPKKHPKNKDKVTTPVEAYFKSLGEKKFIKSLGLDLYMSQRSMNALQELFLNAQDLQELNLSLRVSNDYVISAPLIPFNRMTQLTELKLLLPHSAESCFRHLTKMIGNLVNLRVIEFVNFGEGLIGCDVILSLMKKMGMLTQLRKFIFDSAVGFGINQTRTAYDISAIWIQSQLEVTAYEIRRLVIQCKMLELISVLFTDLAQFEYVKYIDCL